MLGVAAGLTLVAAFGVGCGSSGDSTGGAATTASAGTAAGSGGSGDSSGCTEAENGTVEVVTTNFDFDPDCITTTGDRIRLGYGSKKLKRLFQERPVGRSRRASVPVLTDNAGMVLWAVGVARSGDAVPGEARPVLEITVVDVDTG